MRLLFFHDPPNLILGYSWWCQPKLKSCATLLCTYLCNRVAAARSAASLILMRFRPFRVSILHQNSFCFAREFT